MWNLRPFLLALGLCATADGFRPQGLRMSSGSDPAHRVRQAFRTAFLASGLSFGGLSPNLQLPFLGAAPAVAAPAGAARLNSGSAGGSRVNKDAESLLRYALPIQNKEVRELQAAVEDVKSQIAIRQWSAGLSDVKKASSVLKAKVGKMLAAVPQARKAQAEAKFAELSKTLDGLTEALETDGGGEVKGEAKLKASYALQDKAAVTVGDIEELMLPVDYHVSVPKEYKDLPYLDGRARVSFTLKKAERGDKFDVDGNLYDSVTLDMIVDGYTAPITAGNFVDLVNKGFYKDMIIKRSDGFVVQTGEPKGADTAANNGYVPPGASEPRRVPLEINLVGDKEPMYSLTVDDDGRGGQQAKLPFQSTGALGMARGEFENDSGSSQFFWLLFESDLTPAGKNMMDGRYASFGYTINGADFLKDVKEGDVIVNTKVVEGLKNLHTP